MTRARRLLLFGLAALGALLVVVGTGGLVGDATARVAAAERVFDDISDVYEDEQGYSPGPRGVMLRGIVADSLANDGPLPILIVQDSADFPQVSYGAFGGIGSYVPLSRPWAPRLLVAPIAAGAVLLVVVLLVGAAEWTPRRRSTARSE